MDIPWQRGIGLFALGFAACFGDEAARGADAVVDGGFESPAAPAAGTLPLEAGRAFSAWTVVGPGRVAIVHEQFMRAGIRFGAAAGHQWLDLAGAAGPPAGGVQQVVRTMPGQSYRLRFHVGNVVNPAAGLGRSSTVLVKVNGAHVLSATNSEGNAAAFTWKPFTLTIVPTTTRTTIAFLNGDPPDDGSNGLDDVSLTPVTPDEDE
jgi:hypothetical protein